jgi:hypothetical protein
VRSIAVGFLGWGWPTSVKDWADVVGAVSTFAAVVVALGQYGSAPKWAEGNDLNVCVTMIPPGRYRVPAPKGFNEASAPGMNTRLDATISFRGRWRHLLATRCGGPP